MPRCAWSTFVIAACMALVVVPSAAAAMEDVTVTAARGADGAVATYAVPASWTSGTCTPPSGSFFPIGDNAVFCSGIAGVDPVFDAFQVHVLPADELPPTIVGGSDIVVEATSSAGAVVTYASPTVADDREGVGAPNCTPASGSLFPVGLTAINCTATDAAGNSTSKLIRSVTVVPLAEPDVVNTIPPFRASVGKIFAPTRWALVNHGVRVPITCSAGCSATVSLQTVRRVKQGARYVTTYVRIGGVGTRIARIGRAQSVYASLNPGQARNFTKARAHTKVSARLVVTIKRAGAAPVVVQRAIQL